VIAPKKRLDRMRTSFEANKSVLVDDYRHFTMPVTPRESIRQNKAAHRSAGQNERQSLEQSETQSSGKTDD
jgi:hypothetical protein